MALILKHMVFFALGSTSTPWLSMTFGPNPEYWCPVPITIIGVSLRVMWWGYYILPDLAKCTSICLEVTILRHMIFFALGSVGLSWILKSLVPNPDLWYPVSIDDISSFVVMMCWIRYLLPDLAKHPTSGKMVFFGLELSISWFLSKRPHRD